MLILGTTSTGGGAKPSTPVIGTASDGGTGTTVSVAFTPSTYIGKGTITYTVTSSPGNITATGSSSPITVTGLTTGQAYTFTVTGTTNYGVSSDSSAASNSVTPAVPGAFDSIASATPSGTNTVTFSSIPQTFSHLQIRAVVATTDNQSGTMYDYTVRINGVSTTSYYTQEIRSTSTNVNATSANYDDTAFYLYAWGAAQSYVIFAPSILDFLDYTSTNKAKSIRYVRGGNNNAGNNNSLFRLGNTLFNSISNPITSITFTMSTGNFTGGTTFALYGIRGSYWQ